MTRRDLLKGAGAALVATGAARGAGFPDVLPGSQKLDWEGDLPVRMMDGAHRFVERKIAESVAGRPRFWKRDLASREAYEKSVEPNRERFRKMIGVVDPRVPAVMERFGDDENPALVGETPLYRVFQARWPVLDGVTGEGLLLEPKSTPVACVVALPGADQTPEQLLAGTFVRALAWSGVVVVIPAMIDLSSRWSGHPEIKLTNQPHREWIYRQAFHMGRHVIGYEVQKVLAAVDWFQAQHAGLKVGVTGHREGGLIAFYSAAADTRIDSALVGEYFDSRQGIGTEPIYHNVWGLLTEFGDAELASLIAPRGLVVESGSQAEFARIDTLVPPGFQPRVLVEDGLEAFGRQIGVQLKAAAGAPPSDRRKTFDPEARQKRQVLELENHVQALVHESAHTREKFYLYKVAPELADNTWNTDARHPALSPAKFIEASKWYREYLSKEVIGKFDDPPLAPNPRSRKIYDREKWVGYEVTLEVFPDLFAWGILCVPKDIRPGERRPVVVCQHGRNGVPKDVVEGNEGAYRDFAARLAEQGFVTFAPHNLYRGEDRYRYLSRKANGIQASLFSFIVPQHAQLLRWLGTLDFVDSKHIAFYGLSYGGEAAVRLPALLEGYALSICSGDFNSWTEKVAGTNHQFGYMYSIEWEMPYFDMGNTFDYAEMTYLILPRPFMVERGHDDRVSRDELVAHEYAKVRWLYAKFGLEGRTEMEYFSGGHTIHGEGTFAFLRKHLNWPAT